MRIIAYIHIGAMELTVTQPIVDELVQRMIESGLYDKLEAIRVGVVGSESKMIVLPRKASVVFYNDDASVYEIPTLNNMHDFASKNKDTLILYVHTKGATQKRCNGVNYQIEWSRLMQHFCIDRHEQCIRLLDTYKTVGCLMEADHYCGNFWWARGDYIATKKKISPDKSGWGRGGEFWIMNPPIKNSHVSLFDSNLQRKTGPPCNGLYGNYVLDYQTHNEKTYRINFETLVFVKFFLVSLVLLIVVRYARFHT